MKIRLQKFPFHVILFIGSYFAAETEQTGGMPAPELGEIMKKLLIKLIEGYQRYISPLKGRPTCRFYPSCSRYAVMAIEKYGALRGSLKAVWRLLRCNPFSKGGIDYP